MIGLLCLVVFFFFNDTATTEIYTLSLHDALPILRGHVLPRGEPLGAAGLQGGHLGNPDLQVGHRAAGSGLVPQPAALDRKSTRLNSSHANISYAVFCLKKKKNAYTAFMYCDRPDS